MRRLSFACHLNYLVFLLERRVKRLAQYFLPKCSLTFVSPDSDKPPSESSQVSDLSSGSGFLPPYLCAHRSRKPHHQAGHRPDILRRGPFFPKRRRNEQTAVSPGRETYIFCVCSARGDMKRFRATKSISREAYGAVGPLMQKSTQ